MLVGSDHAGQGNVRTPPEREAAAGPRYNRRASDAFESSPMTRDHIRTLRLRHDCLTYGFTGLAARIDRLEAKPA